MGPRIAPTAALAGSGGVVVFWMVWSVSSRLDRIGVDVAALSTGLAGLESKIDLLMGQLRHAQPGGFHDSAPHGRNGPAATGGGDASLSQAAQALDEQLHRLSQGFAQFDRLGLRLEAAVHLAETSFGGGGAHSNHGETKDAHVDVDGAAPAVGHVRHGGERGLKSESDFGRPANYQGSPPDNANEALWQQTIKMDKGDPLPLVGRAYHPWYSNADHSRKTT